MQSPLVQAVNLSKEFKLSQKGQRIFALSGVDFSIDSGEIVGLVGESGCGKTTLGRCLIRLIEPTSGSVSFDGVDISTLSGENLRSTRRQMQIVFQDPFGSLDPRWRIYEIIEEPLRVHNIVPTANRQAEVIRLLHEVGLAADAAYRFPHEFSGGQRQRIGIARAIALRPRFLVADEPVSALDVSVRAQILTLLLKLRDDRGISILFIGHDLGVVRQTCSRIAVMYMGKIVESASSDELFDNPRHPYTRALLSAIPRIQNIGRPLTDMAIASGEADAKTTAYKGCRFRARCPFSKEICETEEPELNSVSSITAHQSACHFAKELPAFNLVTNGLRTQLMDEALIP